MLDTMPAVTGEIEEAEQLRLAQQLVARARAAGVDLRARAGS
jgi:hypothetical protein